jgi:hypothetical protein
MCQRRIGANGRASPVGVLCTRHSILLLPTLLKPGKVCPAAGSSTAFLAVADVCPLVACAHAHRNVCEALAAPEAVILNVAAGCVPAFIKVEIGVDAFDDLAHGRRARQDGCSERNVCCHH